MIIYRISATTYARQTVKTSLLSHDPALDYFTEAISCEDCMSATIINGCTGEVFYQWERGKFIVLDSVVL